MPRHRKILVWAAFLFRTQPTRLPLAVHTYHPGVRPLATALTLAAAVLLALAPGCAAAGAPAVFVGNGGTRSVPAFDATGAPTAGFTAPAGFTDLGGIAYNPANHTLYVANSATNQIRTFDARTGAETQLGFGNAVGLDRPNGLAIADGVLYVISLNSGTIRAYRAANGAQVTSGFVTPSDLSNPTCLAVAGQTLYVVNHGNGSVGAYNLATGTARPGFQTITGLGKPYGVALRGNELFVSDYNAGTVGEYDATTGAAINERFLHGLRGLGGMGGPGDVAVLGSQLFVGNTTGLIGVYGLPAGAKSGNEPTSAKDDFITGLDEPGYLAVVAPKTGGGSGGWLFWLLLLGGAVWAYRLRGRWLPRVRAAASRARAAAHVNSVTDKDSASGL